MRLSSTIRFGTEPVHEDQMARPPVSFDDYLGRLDGEQRAALQSLRATIRRLLPAAEERIAYGICVFHLRRGVVGFGASGDRCALYLMSNRTVAEHPELLAGYDTSTGTVRFEASRPLPKSLVTRLVKARLAEHAETPAKAEKKAARSVVRRKISR